MCSEEMKRVIPLSAEIPLFTWRRPVTTVTVTVRFLLKFPIMFRGILCFGALDIRYRLQLFGDAKLIQISSISLLNPEKEPF